MLTGEPQLWPNDNIWAVSILTLEFKSVHRLLLMQIYNNGNEMDLYIIIEILE